jgi:PAS domain S-box-containing protein
MTAMARKHVNQKPTHPVLQTPKSVRLSNILRQRAEKKLKSELFNLNNIPDSDLRNVFQELQVHQIELEMQNEELRRAQIELEAARTKYSDLYDFAPVGYFTFNRDGLILEVNLTGAALLGMERSHLIKKSFNLYIKKESQDEFYFHRETTFNTLQHQICELKLKKRDRADFFAQLDSKFFVDSDGNKLCRTSVINITERKKAEKELSKYREHLEDMVEERTRKLNLSTRHLEAAFEDMGAFRYSISHDLKAPLSVIRAFAVMLAEEHSDNLDKEGRRLLDVINANAVQMGQLIEGILMLSRMSQRPLKKTEIDMKKLAESVFAELKEEYHKRVVHFNIKTVPACMGDSLLIKQVLTNIIGNAVKFTGKREEAEIEMGSRQVNGENTYYIKDNGAGLDMKYADRMFGLFQRLHSSNEFEGTGAGLAIVQRIIHRHGGKIWAEAEPGKGSRFYISLPETQ